MNLLSVNIAQPRPIVFQGRQVMTAIFKQPIEGRRAVHSLGVEGDAQADLNAHGGKDKAVYGYPQEHYGYWQDQLGAEPFPYGQFGENFTVSGLLEDDLQIGDILEIGSTTLQVSQPRVPCFKLGVRMGDQSFLKTFLHSLRVGFYLRVLSEGHVEAGDPIKHTRSSTPSITVRDLFHLRHLDRSDRQLAQQAAELPALTESWREAFRDQAQES